MNKFVENLLFGLAFGCGFWVAQALLQFVAGLLARSAAH